MSDKNISSFIEFWKEKLSIIEYKIDLLKISTEQVVDDDMNIGNEFVGIHADHSNLKAHLYHTRKLYMSDIIHELLHVRYPKWTELQVISETDRLMNVVSLRGGDQIEVL